MSESESSNAPTVTSPALTAGRRVFGRFVLEAEAGRGGMGVVWAAHDERLDERVALKFIADHLRWDQVGLADLRNETQRMRRLTHPNIVRVHDLCEEPTMAALAMEFIEGGTLTAARLACPRGVMNCEDIEAWLPQLCAALDYAHEAGVVHRDLKPGNIMLTTSGQVKIADFGIARSLADSQARVSSWAMSGTLAYMSPQQQLGESAGVADDLYSIGALLYEMLTGKPPFYTGNILAQAQSRRPLSVAGRRRALGVVGLPDVPARWEQALAACLAKDPANRPQSAGELLAMVRGERTGKKRGISEWSKWVAMASLTVAAGAALIWSEQRRRDAGNEPREVRAVASPPLPASAGPFVLTRTAVPWSGDQNSIIRSEVASHAHPAGWEALKRWADATGPTAADQLGLGPDEIAWIRHEGIGTPDNHSHFAIRRPNGPGMKVVVATAADGALELTYNEREWVGRIVATTASETTRDLASLSSASFGETHFDPLATDSDDGWFVEESGAVRRSEGRLILGASGGSGVARHALPAGMQFLTVTARGNLADNVAGMRHRLLLHLRSGRSMMLTLERPEGAEPRLRALSGLAEAPTVTRALPGGFGEFALDLALRDRRMRVRLRNGTSSLEIWNEVLVFEDLRPENMVAIEWQLESAGGKEVWLEALSVRAE